MPRPGTLQFTLYPDSDVWEILQGLPKNERNRFINEAVRAQNSEAAITMKFMEFVIARHPRLWPTNQQVGAGFTPDPVSLPRLRDEFLEKERHLRMVRENPGAGHISKLARKSNFLQEDVT